MSENHYKLIKSTDTTKLKEEILELRENRYNENLFFNNEIYVKIFDSIINNKITLILGNPLSGKTRIVYDTLKSMNREFTLIIPKKDKSINEYRLPEDIIEDYIILFDDIVDYCFADNVALKKLLTYIIRKGYKCIITCRFGPEYKKLHENVGNDVLGNLISHQFIIPKFSANEPDVNHFLTSNSSAFLTHIDNFDGNFGSIMLPLGAMRDRFQDLVKATDKEIEVSILLGLKLHYHFYNYESNKRAYNNYKIKQFVIKYLSMHDINNRIWDIALNTLITNTEALNFISLYETNILIEEAYLDFLNAKDDKIIDVVHPDHDLNRLKSLLNELYPTPNDKHTHGFPTSISEYAKAIREAKNFDKAYEIYKSLPNEIIPNEYIFSAVLHHETNDHDKIREIYAQCIKLGIKYSNSVNTCVAMQFDTVEDIYQIFFELNPNALKHVGAISNTITKVVKKRPAETLNWLFTKFSPNEIFTNPLNNRVCKVCCKSIELYEQYIKPNLPIIRNIETENLRNYLVGIIVLFEPQIALEILEKFTNKTCFEYYFFSAIAKAETEVEEALGLYILASKRNDAKDEAKNIGNKQSAIIGYCELVYKNELESHYNKAIEISNQGLKWHSGIYPVSPLKRVNLLLKIEMADEVQIINILNASYVGAKSTNSKKNSAIKNLLQSVKSETKKSIIESYRNTIPE